MRNFTQILFSLLAVTVLTTSAKSQCATPQGMTATPLTFDGNCYMYIQFALPNSNVSIYNANGFVGQTTANPQGIAAIAYDCAVAPITGVLSLSNGQICDDVTISTPATLPVKYTYFRSELIAGGVELKWATSYEFNNQKFVIEKSYDGRNYAEIGSIAGSEYSVSEKAYSFVDPTYQRGTSAYYRIRQVDIDGRFEYSKVVFVDSRSSGTDKVKLFPNPITGNEPVQISGVNTADLNKGNIRVFNVTGNAVGFKMAGSNAIQIDENAPTGVYIIRILDQSYRLLKK